MAMVRKSIIAPQSVLPLENMEQHQKKDVRNG
jgi:hypothetical protein